jgi:hypothetical protein
MEGLDPKALPEQCMLPWDWDKIDVQEEGFQRVELTSYIKLLTEHNYWIVTIAITEYDETGYPLHAIIIALPPADGKLHL